MELRISASRTLSSLAGATLLLAAALAAGSGTAQSKQSGTAGAGGSAVAHRAGGVPIRAGNTPEARWYDTGLDAGEPTIGHTRDGTIFFVGADIDFVAGRPNQVDVARSTDKGATWEVVSPRLGPENRHPITLDPYIWVDERTNRVYTIDLTVACSYMSYSDDKGDSWITHPLACGRPVNDHQTLFGGPPVSSPTVGYPNILYYCWNDVATSSCGKSLDGGVTWHPTGEPAYRGVDPSNERPGFLGVKGFCGGLHGHGVVGADGSVYLPRELCGQPWLAISRDEGRTWDRVLVAKLPHPDGADPNVAVDKKGNVYYAWIGPKYLLYLAISRDGGKTWDRPMMVAAPGVTEANLPAIDVGAPGKIAISYMGSENSPGKPDKQGADYSRVTWNGYLTMSANVLSRNPVFYSASANTPRDPLIRGKCGPGRCGRVFDFIDVEIAPDGTPWGAFVDGCIEECVDGTSSMGDKGFVGRLVGGPLLR